MPVFHGAIDPTTSLSEYSCRPSYLENQKAFEADFCVNLGPTESVRAAVLQRRSLFGSSPCKK